MKCAVLPGSYDPITIGHLEIIKRASKMYDNIIVAIGKNDSKEYLLTEKQRLALIYDAIKDIKNATAEVFDGYLVDFVNSIGKPVIVKGIRNYADYIYEQEMAQKNKDLSRERCNFKAETVLLVSSKEFSHISSSFVKKILYDADKCKNLVPNYDLLIEMLSKK